MRYLILLLAAAFSFAGCDDDEVLGKQNAGKERPEVTITPGGVTDTEAAFTLSVSAGAQEYGYVVLQDTALDTPSAYDILTNSVAGTVSRGVYSTEEAASQTVSFACEANAVYTVFAAAITSTGLTSKVKYLLHTFAVLFVFPFGLIKYHRSSIAAEHTSKSRLSCF